jgi:hypothetical protein
MSANLVEDLLHHASNESVIDNHLVGRRKVVGKSGKIFNMLNNAQLISSGNYVRLFSQNYNASVGDGTTMGATSRYVIRPTDAIVNKVGLRMSLSSGTLSFATPALLIDEYKILQDGREIFKAYGHEIVNQHRLMHSRDEATCKIPSDGMHRYLDQTTTSTLSNAVERTADAAGYEVIVPLDNPVFRSKFLGSAVAGELVVEVKLIASAYGHEDATTNIASAHLEVEYVELNKSTLQALKSFHATNPTHYKGIWLQHRQKTGLTSSVNNTFTLNEQGVICGLLIVLRNATAISNYQTFMEQNASSESISWTLFDIQDERNQSLVHNRALSSPAEHRLLNKSFFKSDYAELEPGMEFQNSIITPFCTDVQSAIASDVESGWYKLKGQNERIIVNPAANCTPFIYLMRWVIVRLSSSGKFEIFQ